MDQLFDEVREGFVSGVKDILFLSPWDQGLATKSMEFEGVFLEGLGFVLGLVLIMGVIIELNER